MFVTIEFNRIEENRQTGSLSIVSYRRIYINYGIKLCNCFSTNCAFKVRQTPTHRKLASFKKKQNTIVVNDFTTNFKLAH